MPLRKEIFIIVAMSSYSFVVYFYLHRNHFSSVLACYEVAIDVPTNKNIINRKSCRYALAADPVFMAI